MAKVGAQRAAELTEKSKSTIQRAMKSGKLSFERDGNNRRVIDVSELERAFGLVPQESEHKGKKKAVKMETENTTQMLERERLKMRIKLLEEQLDMSRDQVDDLKGQRDQWQKQAQQTLITSQYSQKQAEDLKEEIKNRELRVRMRRQQQMEQRVKSVKKTKDKKKKISLTLEKSALDIQSLWHKIRGQDNKSHSVFSDKTEDKKKANA